MLDLSTSSLSYYPSEFCSFFSFYNGYIRALTVFLQISIFQNFACGTDLINTFQMLQLDHLPGAVLDLHHDAIFANILATNVIIINMKL